MQVSTSLRKSSFLCKPKPGYEICLVEKDVKTLFPTVGSPAVSKLSLFAPFSKNYLPCRKSEPPGKSALPFCIDAGVGWHWHAGWSDLAGYFGDLGDPSSANFPLYHLDGHQLAIDQPIWCLEDYLNAPLRRAPLECSPVSSSDASLSGNGLPEDFSWQPIERLAYYCAAHSVKRERYGIHLHRKGVARMSAEIHQKCPDEPLIIVQLAAVYSLLAHELCHAWIEDLCSVVDFLQGVDKSKAERRYSLTHRRHRGYILMEEALCNTAAYGWLHGFLQAPDCMVGMPSFDPERILCAFEKWMRQQPLGYRDFVAINDAPVQSEIFVGNICRLLIQLYGVEEVPEKERDVGEWVYQMSHGLTEAVELFFGCEMKPAIGHVLMRKTSRHDALWAGAVPIRIEA